MTTKSSFIGVVWAIALLAAGWKAVEFWLFIDSAQSAPQQAALATVYIVAAYVIARALEKMNQYF